MSISLKEIGNSLVPENERGTSETEEEEFQRNLEQAIKKSLDDIGQTKSVPKANKVFGSLDHNQRSQGPSFSSQNINRVQFSSVEGTSHWNPPLSVQDEISEEEQIRIAMELSMKPSEQVCADDQMLFRVIEDSKVQIGARLGPRIDSNYFDHSVPFEATPFTRSNFGPPLHDLGDFNHYHSRVQPKDSNAMILEDEAFARSLASQELMRNPTGPYAAAAKKVKPLSMHGMGSRNIYADPAKTVVVPTRPRRIPEPGARRRPIIVDGCNVGFEHGKHDRFSALGLRIVYQHFVQKYGYTEDEITIVIKHIPNLPPEDLEIIESLKKIDVLLTSPGRVVGDKKIISDDDLFILELARDKNGIVVSKDQFRQYQDTKDKGIKEVILKRVLQFVFKGNEVYFPSDPLGKGGVKLDDFLKH